MHQPTVESSLPSGSGLSRAVPAPPLSGSVLDSRQAAAQVRRGVRVRSRAAAVVLSLVLLLALSLRLWGMLHDLPFSYYGDELHFMRRAMAIGTGDLNPHWFHKPAFLMYVLAFVYGLYFLAGLLAGRFVSTAEFGAHFLFEPAPFLVLGRLVVVAFGVATVYLVYRIGRRVFNTPWAGIAGALVAAVLAPMVASSVTIKSDVPCGFLMTLSVSVYLRTRETPSWRPLLLAALLAGMAMGTHYYGIVLVPAFLALELLRGFSPSGRWRTALLRATVAGVLFVAGFFAASPYNFLDPTWPRATALSVQKSLGLTEEPAVSYEPDSQTEYTPGPAAWAGAAGAFVDLVLSREVLGVALTLLVILGTAATLVRRETRWYGLLVLIPCSFFFLAAITVAAYHAQPRHLNAIYPLLATLVWPGALVLARLVRQPEARTRAIALILAAAAALPSAVRSVEFNRQINRRDSRLVAYRWIQANVPRNARILVDDYGPYLNPSPASADRLAAILATLPKGPFTHNQDLRIELLRKYPPEDGLNLDELGHQWWQPREKTDAELRSHPVDLDMGNPLVTRSPKPVEAFRTDGVRYVITNSDARDQYFKSRGKGFPSFVRFYTGLERTKRIATFDPRDWGGKGPVLWVYDLHQPAPPDQKPLTTEGHLPWAPPEL
jgi:4-amino-4-deoxy-L-arabinose transferase-like glycosyltransferase